MTDERAVETLGGAQVTEHETKAGRYVSLCPVCEMEGQARSWMDYATNDAERHNRRFHPDVCLSCGARPGVAKVFDDPICAQCARARGIDIDAL